MSITRPSLINENEADRLVRLERVVKSIREGAHNDLDLVAIINAVAETRSNGSSDFLIKLALGVLTLLLAGAIGGSIQLYGRMTALEVKVISSTDEVRLLREEIKQWRTHS